jgi:hypothetical protein
MWLKLSPEGSANRTWCKPSTWHGTTPQHSTSPETNPRHVEGRVFGCERLAGRLESPTNHSRRERKRRSGHWGKIPRSPVQQGLPHALNNTLRSTDLREVNSKKRRQDGCTVVHGPASQQRVANSPVFPPRSVLVVRKPSARIRRHPRADFLSSRRGHGSGPRRQQSGRARTRYNWNEAI